MANIIIQDVRQARKEELAGKQDTIITFAALMGRGDGERPDVDGREGYVWVRVGHAQALQMAYNSRVMPRDDLAIFVGYEPEQPNLLQVISVRQESYVNTNQGMIPVVKDHHLTHEWGGGDDVWIAYRRLVDLHLGQPAGFVVTLNPGLVYRNGAYMWIPQQTIDLSGSQPAVGAQARYVLVYLDALGVLSSRDGTIRPNPTALLVSDIPIPLAGEIAIAAVRLYASQTAIGDDPDNRDIVELRDFQPFSAAGVHELLSATHDDTTVAACVLGDVITGQAGPAWARLAISVPAANVRNVLGVDNAETGPSWKTALDGNNPTTIGIGDAAAPGTSLIFSHRDHQHASPATWTATAHNLLSAIHGDTVVNGATRGSLIYGNATPKWDELVIGGGAGSLLTRDANDVAWSTFYLTGHANRTYHFPDYDMSLPAADAHGYLHSDGVGTLTWDAGAGGAPGGNDHNVQFNDGGAFGGSDNLTWDHTRLMAQIADAGTTTAVYPLRVSHITSGTADAGLGVGIEFQNENSAGNALISGMIASRWIAADTWESRYEIRGSINDGAGGITNVLLGVICSPLSLAAGGMIDGNARGFGAIELQTFRANATEVASGAGSTVVGGWQQTASGETGTVVGGSTNTASGVGATCIGGSENVAGGTDAVTVGGEKNSINAAALYCVAMGRRSTIGAHSGVFMFADSEDADFDSVQADEAAFRVSWIRNAYDNSYYSTWATASDGDVTFDITHAAGTPTFTFTHGVIMNTLTASTVIYSDASKQIVSLANGAGVLTNDGAGGLSWGAAAAHNLLSATHTDTAAQAVSRGSLVYGDSTPAWNELVIGGAAGSVLTRDANDVLWSAFYLSGTAGQTYTFPAAGGTVAMLNAANAFTNDNTIASGKFLTALTDGNTGGLRAGSGSDVLWYRGAANTWQTPDALTVDGLITGSSGVTIPTTTFFNALTDGSGGGYKAGTAGDVLLYRGAANKWQTPDSVLSDGYLEVNNSMTALNAADTHPVIYGTASTGGAYPFLTAGNLVIQSRPSGANRDIVLVCAATIGLTVSTTAVTSYLNLLPSGNKTLNLGAAGTRWNTLYQGTSTAAGTSRLVRSTRLCPVCKAEMVRGTGSLCILGETADYEVAHCPKCGTLATEEMRHLPDSQKAKRKPAPQIKFVGFRVFEMSGNSRKVRVDFDYGNDVKNSTYLGETELAELITMTEKQRQSFLQQLGQREWDALEETRLMQETCASLQSDLDAIGAQFVGKDL